jgi:integrase
MARPIRAPRLEKRGESWNIVRYLPPTPEKPKGRTQRIGLRTRDDREAQMRFAAFLTTGFVDIDRARGDAGITVSKALDDYFMEHVRKEVVGQVRQEQIIRHLKAHFGSVSLSSVDIPACRLYAQIRRDGVIGGGSRRKGLLKKGTDSTIRRELGVLKAAANHALRWKRIGSNEMPTFETPAENSDGQEAGWLTKAEVEVLYAKCDERIALAEMLETSADSVQALKDFIVLAYWWGARRGWVEALQVSQVNLVTGRVNPYKPGQKVTKKRRMPMPIFDAQRPVLERLCAGKGPDGWLFGPRADFYRLFRGLCESCKFGDRSNPHILRHSRATHMLMDGENPYKVARLLGDTLATVERVYGHHSPDFLAEKEAP